MSHTGAISAGYILLFSYRVMHSWLTAMFVHQTEISIRERGKRELFDLALHVARRHFGPLALALVLGAAPFVAFNAWALAPIAEYDETDIFGGDERDSYITYMTLLVFLEAPLATSLMTIYLGQVLFRARPTARQLVREFRRSAGQLFWYQGVVRGTCVALVAAAFNDWRDFTLMPEFVVWCAALWALAARGFRPYLNEVILLERNPRRAERGSTMTTARRNAALHAGFAGDSFVQTIGAGMLGFLTAGSLWLTISNMRALLFNVVDADRATFTVVLPIALWTTVWFLAIVRFLGYLDLRIRREGWEVELRVRAEAATMTRTVA